MKTGMNSVEAAHTSQHAFDQIFDRPYEWFNARMPHEWARRARYVHGDIESELLSMLSTNVSPEHPGANQFNN